MKEYILDSREASSYIRDVRKSKDGSLTVEFADGRIFRGVHEDEDNLSKIIATQEEQAKRGIENYSVFKRAEMSSRFKTVLSGVGALAFGTGLTFVPSIQQALQGQNPMVTVAGVGAITILGMIPAYAKLHHSKGVVRELDKLRYRGKHFDDLESFREYPNALTGLNPQTANWIRNSSDPFCILNIDCYEKEDLEQIMENIEVERKYDFTYQKKKSRRR